MKEYTKPQIKQKDIHATDVITVSNVSNQEIRSEHQQGSKAILAHEWKDTWN